MRTTNDTEKEIIKKILGYTEDVTICDCCGKSDLKGTYAIEFNGEIGYFGSVCAFKLHGIEFIEQKEIKKAHKNKLKALDKFKLIEDKCQAGNNYWITELIKFAEKSKLMTNDLILKYGKKIDENIYCTWYEVGNLVRTINRESHANQKEFN